MWCSSLRGAKWLHTLHGWFASAFIWTCLILQLALSAIVALTFGCRNKQCAVALIKIWLQSQFPDESNCIKLHCCFRLLHHLLLVTQPISVISNYNWKVQLKPCLFKDSNSTRFIWVNSLLSERQCTFWQKLFSLFPNLLFYLIWGAFQ